LPDDSRLFAAKIPRTTTRINPHECCFPGNLGELGDLRLQESRGILYASADDFGAEVGKALAYVRHRKDLQHRRYNDSAAVRGPHVPLPQGQLDNCRKSILPCFALHNEKMQVVFFPMAGTRLLF